MPRGDKSSYSDKQKRMAGHIEDSVKEKGGSEKKAERIAWATVNKEFGKAGAKKIKDKSPSRKGGKKGGAKRRKSTTH